MKKMLAFLLFVFTTQNLWGAITQNTADGCSDDYIDIDNNHSDIVAIYVLNTHACINGEFLPANVDECRVCPSNRTCAGGTYAFNENRSQGVSLDYFSPFSQSLNNACIKDLIETDTNNHGVYTAIFTPNTHTCSTGYYLPANVDECTLCPAGSKCVGGTYTFNETVPQGIVECIDGYFAPTGSGVCYQHIMHVGDDIVYLRSDKITTPSLNVKIGNDIFYANMTQIRTRMNKDSEHYFRVRWQDNDYYICDDTMCPQ